MAPKVLIVDDCEDSCTLFKVLFEKLGAQVVTALNGADGIKAVAECGPQPFHLVMMDICMPHMNGRTASKQLRDSGYKGVIAACTAVSSGEGRKESQTSGIDLYFDKRVVNLKLCSALLERAFPMGGVAA